LGGKRAELTRAPDSGPARSVMLRRRKPRSYAEWSALKRWGKLPPWEEVSWGFTLREARERAELTQEALASILGVTQQSVAQAERWSANPTLRFLQSWAEACGVSLQLALVRPTSPIQQDG